MVEVLVLGTVSVLAEGVTESVRSDKQRLIAAHVALAGGRPVSEHLLIEELWQTAPADPLHALQAHVSRLRQATALPIEHTPGGYQIEPEQVGVDASRFEELLRGATLVSQGPEPVIQALQDAIALWRGPALENLPATPGLHAHRARLNLLYDQAVTELVDAYLAADRPEAALPLLHQAVELNPVDERSWGQLMIALDRAGQRGQALETFSRAREQLIDRLGLEPNIRLQQIQHAILNDNQSLERERSGSTAHASPPPDLVGRDSEWAVLARLWREAGTQQRVAVICGEPGIGKTYLASRFASALMDVPVHSGRCHATHGVPYEPLSQLIRSDCSDLSSHQLAERLGASTAALRSLVPDVVARTAAPEPAATAPLDPQVEHHRIKLGLIDWLRRATESGPLCLVIDDLQWADADSLRLIAELWSQPQELPVLWVVTLRQHEHLPDAPRAALIDRAGHPSESVVQIALEGLSRPAVADLMRTAMDGGHDQDGRDQDMAARTLDDVLVATAGNPLFVLETARHLADRGGDDGAVMPRPVPPSLATVVDGHVSRLSSSARELLEVAAIIGEEFDPLLAGMAADREPQELDEFLAIAQHLRLLEPVGTDRPRHKFRHALVHAVVLQQIGPLRRAELHLRVADAVDRHPHIPDRLHVLAHHHARAVSLAGADEAISHVLAAAEASLRQRAPAVALDLYRQARDLLTAESPAAQRCEIHLGLGEAGFRAGADYRHDLLTAARLAHDAGDVDRLVRAAVANNRGWYSSIAEVDRDRVAVIDAALSMLPGRADTGHQAARARLLSLWAMENVRDASRRTAALRRSDESMRIAEDLGDQVLLGEIMCHRFSVLYATLADPAGTFEFARHLDEFAHARIDPELQLNSAIAVAQSSMMLGDFGTADRSLARSKELATTLAHPPRLWLVSTWIASRTAMRGDVDGATVQATEALEMGMAFEQPDAFTWFSGQLFAFHHVTGRLPELVEAVEEQVAALTDQIPAWRAAYALTLTRVDRWAEARLIIDEFRSTGFDQLPVDVLYLHGLSYLAEATVEMRYADAASDLYEALLPYEGMVANNATIDAGPIDLRLGGLAAVVGDHLAARRHLRAAESFCYANNALSWLDHVLKAKSRLI